ncbi:MAG TPA: TssN family type VI secretion system protein [Bacteroidales bacterium]|nr:TssN family type VI secretion system protein [Bacteroidales bacterium]
MNPSGIALKFAGLFLSLGMLMVLFRKVASLKKYGFSSVLYVLSISLLLTIPSLFSFSGINVTETILLIFAQTFIIAVGTLHNFLASRSLPWYRLQSFSLQMIFVLCILFFSYFLYNLSFSIQNVQFSPVWHISLLWFMIPVLLKKTGDELINVPSKAYKLWHYPVNKGFQDPSEEELENPVIISLIFRKNENSRELTTFRVKAPVGMEFGHLFYYFINDYNDRHPEGTISTLSESREPYGWIFKKVTGRIFKRREVIDHENSIYGNEVKENDILYCQRLTDNAQKALVNETT